jgi:thiamine-monophosphate kinase
VHFWPGEAPQLVAHKALARNISDIAAMGGRPLAALACVIGPRHGDVTWGQALLAGLFAQGATLGAPLVGGDVACHAHEEGWQVAVTVLGLPPEGAEVLTRQGGQPGDLVVVSGSLGGSLEPGPNGAPPHHLAFKPRVELGQALAHLGKGRPVAAMDLSDGLAADLPRLWPHACLELDALPCSAACRQRAARSGQPLWQHAVGDGEDHELLLVFREPPPAQVAGVPLTVVGRLLASGGVQGRLPDGRQVDLTGLGWEHGSSHAATNRAEAAVE